jgi:hypothetical protein
VLLDHRVYTRVDREEIVGKLREASPPGYRLREAIAGHFRPW